MTNIHKIISVTILSIAGYGVWIAISGYEDVKQGFQLVGFQEISILIILSLVNYILRFFRWHWMLREVTKVNVPPIAHFECYIAGFAMTATPGKVGEALRSYYLKPYGIKIPDSLAALFAERLIDLMSVLLLGAFALIHFSQYSWIGAIILIIVIIAAMTIRSTLLIQFLTNRQHTIKHIGIKSLIGHLVNTLNSASKFMTWKIWRNGIFLGVIAWGAEAWGFVLLVRWLTGEEWSVIAAGIYALSMIVGAISFLPGGIGGAEAVMAGLLVLLGTSLADATTATIICRVVTLWLAVVLGLIVIGKFQLSKDRSIPNG